MGQTPAVKIDRLITLGSIEEHVLLRQFEKQSLEQGGGFEGGVQVLCMSSVPKVEGSCFVRSQLGWMSTEIS